MAPPALIGTLTGYFAIESAGTSSQAGTETGQAQNIFRIGTTLYVLGATTPFPRDLGMWKSTDEGVTWGTSQDTYDPGIEGVTYATGIVSGTDIYIALLAYTSPTGYFRALTYDTTTDTFSEGIGTLPLAIGPSRPMQILSSNTYHKIGFTYEPGSGELCVLTTGTALGEVSLYHGDPTVDTTWAVEEDFLASNFNGGPVLIPSSVSGRVHVFYYGSAVDGDAGLARTYDISGASFSSEVSYITKRSNYDLSALGSTNVLALGDNGIDGEVVIAVGHTNGEFGTSDGVPYWDLLAENVSGDIASVVDGGLIDTGADWLPDDSAVAIVPSPQGEAGKFHLFHSDLNAGANQYIRRTTTNFADTFATSEIVSRTADGDISFLRYPTWFDRDGTRILAGMLIDDYYEYSFTSLEATIQPISDIVSARWESAPTASQTLFSQVDEVTPSDTDYIYVDLT